MTMPTVNGKALSVPEMSMGSFERLLETLHEYAAPISDEGPNHQACAIGPVTSPGDEAEASGPTTPPKRPVLTRLPELSNIDGFAEQTKKPRDVLSTY